MSEQEQGCDECDGHGYVFKHVDGDVLMEGCPSCERAPAQSGHKGFWLSVAWKPGPTSPSALKEWRVALIKEQAGVVTFQSLDPAQLASLCTDGKLSMLWLSVITLASEFAKEKARTEALQLRIGALERRSAFGWITALWRRMFKRKGMT